MATHGKNTYFEVNSQDVSQYLNSAGLDKSLDTVEVTTFTKDDKEYIAGLNDATFSLEGVWSADVDGYIDAVKTEIATNGFVTFEYGPAGKANDLIKYSGKAIMTSYNISSDIGSEVSFSASFQVTEAVARGTYSGL